MKKRIVIFASGSGSNAQNLIEYFRRRDNAEIVLVLSNKKDAKVLDRARRLQIDHRSFSKTELSLQTGVLKILLDINPDLIVLAGFLLKFPENILKAFPDKVVNIHPALLPKYGGKGMYGQYVHDAVVADKEIESGITIHYVNEHYDEGAIIFQKSVAISPEDTPSKVAEKIHQLEYEYFPKVIESLLFTEEKKKQ